MKRLNSIYSRRSNKRGSRRDGRQKIGIFNKRAQFFILSAVIMASIIVSLATVKNYVSTGDAPKKFYYYSQQLEEETGAVVDYALYQDPSGSDATITNNLNNFLQKGIEQTLAGYPTMEIIACFNNPNSPGMMICQNNGTNVVKITAGSYTKDLSGNRMKTITQSVSGGGSDCYVGSVAIWEYYEDESWDCVTSPLDCNILGGDNVNIDYKSQRYTCAQFLVYRQNIVASATSTETIGCPTGATCVDSNIPVTGLTSIKVETNTGSYEIPVSSSQIQRGQFYFIFKLNTTSGDYVASSKGN